MDLYRVLSKFDKEEWLLPEKFISENGEFIQ